MDTVDANLELGFADEMRSYEAVADIVEDLKINSIILMTNNPDKYNKLSDLGVPVEGTVYHCVDNNGFDDKYLKTKQERMNHDMGLNIFAGTMSDTKNAYIKNSFFGKVKYNKIIPVDVASGVSDQPFNDEVKIGAKNRAKAAYDQNKDGVNKKIGIGLEGGLLNLNDELYMTCVSVIYDGKNFFFGESSSLKLPSKVSKEVIDRKQFGEEIRKYKPKKEERELVDELISREKSFRCSLEEAVDKYLAKNV